MRRGESHHRRPLRQTLNQGLPLCACVGAVSNNRLSRVSSLNTASLGLDAAAIDSLRPPSAVHSASVGSCRNRWVRHLAAGSQTKEAFGNLPHLQPDGDSCVVFFFLSANVPYPIESFSQDGGSYLVEESEADFQVSRQV